jgi:DNA polymerase-3 subunit beta
MPARKTTASVVEMSGEEFKVAIGHVVKAVSSRPVAPILGGIRISDERGRIRFDGFDYEVHAAAIIDGSGKLAAPVVVPAKLMNELVKTMQPTDTVRLTVEKGKAPRFEFGAVNVPLDHVESWSAADYPNVPQRALTSYTLSGAAWAATMRRVAVAAGTDDTLPFLTAVCMVPTEGGLELAASDRYQLTSTMLPAKASSDMADYSELLVLLGAKALKLMAPQFKTSATIELGFGGLSSDLEVTGQDAAGNTEVTVGKLRHANLVSYGTADQWVTHRTLEGSFIKYKGLFREEDSATATIEIAPLVKAVKMVAPLVERNCPVHLMFEDGKVSLGPNLGTAMVSVPCTHDLKSGYKTGFNPGYLLNALGVFKGTVRLGFGDVQRKPVVFTSPDESNPFRYLVMPIRTIGQEPDPEPEAEEQQPEEAAPETETAEEKPKRTRKTPATRPPAGPKTPRRRTRKATEPTPAAPEPESETTEPVEHDQAEPEQQPAPEPETAEEEEPEPEPDDPEDEEEEETAPEPEPVAADPMDGLAFLAQLGVSARAAARSETAEAGAMRPARQTAARKVRLRPAEQGDGEPEPPKAPEPVRFVDTTVGTTSFMAWAEALAKYLPGGWRVEPVEHCDDRALLIRDEDQATLYPIMQRGHTPAERARPKVDISVKYPEYADYGRFSATVTMNLGAQHAANEIQRRVLPQYLPQLEKCKQSHAERDERRAKRAGVMAVLSAYLPGQSGGPRWPDNNHGDRNTYAGRIRAESGRAVSVDIELDGDMTGDRIYADGIKVTIEGLTIEQMLDVAAYVNGLTGDGRPVFESYGNVRSDEDVQPAATRRKLRRDRVRYERAAEDEAVLKRFADNGEWSLEKSRKLAGESAKSAGHATAFTHHLVETAGVDSTWLKRVEKATATACRERRRTEGYAGQGPVGSGAAVLTSEAAYSWARAAWALAGGALAQTGNPVARAAEWTEKTKVFVGRLPAHR